MLCLSKSKISNKIINNLAAIQINNNMICGKTYTIAKNDIDTDMIIPAKYLNTDNEKELGKHAMEFLDKTFPKKIKGYSIIVSGKNFGCGSSREHAVWCLTSNGIKAVVAESFARIFFRNSINYGLLPVSLENATKRIKNGDNIKINIKKGLLINKTSGKKYKFKSFPCFALEIIRAGGLIKHVIKKKK